MVAKSCLSVGSSENIQYVSIKFGNGSLNRQDSNYFQFRIGKIKIHIYTKLKSNLINRLRMSQYKIINANDSRICSVDIQSDYKNVITNIHLLLRK
jgi:hypothetical protein